MTSSPSESFERTLLVAVDLWCGYDGVKQAAVLDLDTQTWSLLPPMINKRDFAGVAFHNNKLYVVGGTFGRHRYMTVEEFDFTTSRWTIVDGKMSSPRSHCAVVVSSNKMYVIGGYNGKMQLSSVDVFDFTTRQWSELPTMQYTRQGCGAIDYFGMVFVIGGYNDKDRFITVAEVYDPETNKWYPFQTPSRIGRILFAVAAENRKMYVFGGVGRGHEFLSSADMYDIEKGEWSKLPPLPACPGCYGGAVKNGRVYIWGNTQLVYNTESRTWTKLPPFREFRCCGGSCCIATIRM
jgi:N-acetylneuraminic acid mutarotase